MVPCKPSPLNVDFGISPATKTSLKAKVQHLALHEKICSVVMDEVYTSKRLEYTGGRFFGLEDGEVTKTILCFMVKFLAGSFQDVLSMTPISSLDSRKLKFCLIQVLQAAHEVGLHVAVTFADGHSSNVKLHKQELCNGRLQLSVPNPESGRPLYLFFDSVHIFYNMYNKFLNKGSFQCPPFDIQKTIFSPDFNHLRQLY